MLKLKRYNKFFIDEIYAKLNILFNSVEDDQGRILVFMYMSV